MCTSMSPLAATSAADGPTGKTSDRPTLLTARRFRAEIRGGPLAKVRAEPPTPPGTAVLIWVERQPDQPVRPDPQHTRRRRDTDPADQLPARPAERTQRVSRIVIGRDVQHRPAHREG